MDQNDILAPCPTISFLEERYSALWPSARRTTFFLRGEGMRPARPSWTDHGATRTIDLHPRYRIRESIRGNSPRHSAHTRTVEGSRLVRFAPEPLVSKANCRFCPLHTQHHHSAVPRGSHRKILNLPGKLRIPLAASSNNRTLTPRMPNIPKAKRSHNWVRNSNMS